MKEKTVNNLPFQVLSPDGRVLLMAAEGCIYQKEVLLSLLSAGYILKLRGKKITKKALQERIGEERLKRLVQEAKETFLEDPLIQNDFYLGREGMLTIEFC